MPRTSASRSSGTPDVGWKVLSSTMLPAVSIREEGMIADGQPAHGRTPVGPAVLTAGWVPRGAVATGWSVRMGRPSRGQVPPCSGNPAAGSGVPHHGGKAPRCPPGSPGVSISSTLAVRAAPTAASTTAIRQSPADPRWSAPHPHRGHRTARHPARPGWWDDEPELAPSPAHPPGNPYRRPTKDLRASAARRGLSPGGDLARGPSPLCDSRLR